MPRPHGYRERIYGNFYDAVPVLRMDEERIRLFRNVNIGRTLLTNMVVGGQLHGDQTFVLAHAYVRTNLGRTRPTLEDEKRKEVRDLFVSGNDGDAIGTLMRECQWERTPLVKAFEEWAHAAVVTIIVGGKPMFMMNAHDLMDGPSLGPGRVPMEPLPEGETLPWRKQFARPIIIPVRQYFSIEILTEPETVRALKRHAAEAVVLPDPLVWVHLEGLLTRDGV